MKVSITVDIDQEAPMEEQLVRAAKIVANHYSGSHPQWSGVSYYNGTENGVWEISW